MPSLGEQQTKGLESTPWQAVKLDGRDVTIRFVEGGGCSTFQGVRVAQTAKSVELWTVVQTDHAAQACAAYLATRATTIRLDLELGTGTLLHAPVSEDWRAYIDNF